MSTFILNIIPSEYSVLQKFLLACGLLYLVKLTELKYVALCLIQKL
jgi:hypothetical protein